MLKAWNSRSGKHLPYLRRVAYLEFLGSQWLATGISVDSGNVATEMKFHTVRYVNDAHLFGTEDNSVFPGSFYHFTMYSNRWYWGLNGSERNGGDSTDLSNDHLVSYNVNDGQVIFDGSVLGSGSVIRSSRPLQIGRRTGGVGLRAMVFFVRIFNRTDSSDLIANFIPVLDLSGRPAMYDKVSGQLFYNQGTGEFTWGELET